MTEAYLGDGVYAAFDGYHIWLDCRAQHSLAEGPSGTPSIALEPQVLRELIRFAERVKAETVA